MNLLSRVFLASAFALTLTLFSGVAFGQAFDGGTSNPGDWNDPVNWVGDALPVGGVEIGGPVLSPATATITANIPAYGDLRVGLAGGGP